MTQKSLLWLCSVKCQRHGILVTPSVTESKTIMMSHNYDVVIVIFMQGVKLSYKSYKILYFWNCPIKSYIFSKCPINPIFSTKTAIFVNSFKHFQGMGYVSQLYVRGMASLHLIYHPVHAE